MGKSLGEIAGGNITPAKHTFLLVVVLNLPPWLDKKSAFVKLDLETQRVRGEKKNM